MRQFTDTQHEARQPKPPSMPFASMRTLADRGPDKTVYAVKVRDLPKELHAAAQLEFKAQPAQDEEVAAKRFSSAIRGEFEHERKFLQDLACIKNDRIVQLLSSHQLNDNCFLFFPLAHSNLRDYWVNHDAGSITDESTAWFVQETQSLMHALSDIHHISRDRSDGTTSIDVNAPPTAVGIIHGDIKPRNILVFQPRNYGNPILKFNDFGLSTWADTPQSSFTTRTYDAPENGLRLKLGPKSDVWSLGCVLLEFATWLLHGTDAVAAFGEKRSMRTPGSGLPLKDDHFYSLVYADRRPVRATIRDAVAECLRDLRQDRRCVGSLGCVLRVLEENMLVVDEDTRTDSLRLAQILNEETE